MVKNMFIAFLKTDSVGKDAFPRKRCIWLKELPHMQCESLPITQSTPLSSDVKFCKSLEMTFPMEQGRLIVMLPMYKFSLFFYPLKWLQPLFKLVHEPEKKEVNALMNPLLKLKQLLSSHIFFRKAKHGH